MLTVAEALAAIVSEVTPAAPTAVALRDSLGLILAEQIVSDCDSPPFDKALMDGFAVRIADLDDGRATLRVVDEITAGNVPSCPVDSGEAAQIMTGAPIPNGADAVVRVEDTNVTPSDDGTNHVNIETHPPSVGTNIMYQGTAMRVGDGILPAGRRIRPQEVGVLAELGHARIAAIPRPRIGVLATGDELVPVDATPAAGQIRNSNEMMLLAQIARAGGDAVSLGIARDKRDELRECIQQGLQCDFLLLSGGVSAGKLDLVPSELQAAGVNELFHKVRVKPGKPIWFGRFSGRPSPETNSSGGPTYVFGLPGNPVSSMVCFELFVRTAIRRYLGMEFVEPKPIKARLTVEHASRGDRPTYYPARLEWANDGPQVTPVNWQGSADLRSTVEANSMALFPAGDHVHKPGDAIESIEWKED